MVEADGLRCPYHGWLFGTDGSCLDQPAEREETNFRSRVRAAAGVAQELGGLVWAYIGPSPAPELPQTTVPVQVLVPLGKALWHGTVALVRFLRPLWSFLGRVLLEVARAVGWAMTVLHRYLLRPIGMAVS